MQMKRLTSLFCLLLALCLLAGCTFVESPVHAPAQLREEAPVPPTAAAEEPAAQETAEEPAAETAAAEEPAAQAPVETTPEPTPEPESVHLSSGDYPAELETLTAVITAEDLPKLAQFTALKTADFRGSSCQTELAAWALANPQVSVRCEVVLPDGRSLPADTRELDLSASPDAGSLLPLVLLPELQSVELGSCGDAAASNMDWEALAKAVAGCPQAEFHYAFTLFGKDFDLQSTEVDLNHRTMNDEGALVKKVALCMSRLQTLDMDFCEVSNEAMADIRDSLPNTEVIWRVWFGNGKQNGYTARTNAIKILASNPDRAGHLTPDKIDGLKYCTKLRYLDLGHNEQMTDISFVRYMPDLEVAILAMGGFSDLSPLEDCPKLEYLEIQTSGVTDLRPLTKLKNLKHLNICYLFGLTDITPLYEMTSLERIWIGCFDPVPPEQIAELQRRLPNCTINTTCENPTEEGWRYISSDEQGHGVAHPRYALLRQQFEYDNFPNCYNYLINDPLYFPHD